MANFNISRKKDYKLQESMTHELINLYGVAVKLLITEKINKDDLVFGDFSHLKTDSSKIYSLTGLPETSESWDDIDVNFGSFGMVSTENIRLFFSRKSVDSVFGDFDEGKGFSGILGNLIVLPNNRIMEITDIEFEVPGINNLYTQPDQKNVYKFTCKTYNMSLVNEVATTDITPVDSPVIEYTTLNDFFEEMTSESEAVDEAAEVVPDIETSKPVVDTSVDSVFGRF